MSIGDGKFAVLKFNVWDSVAINKKTYTESNSDISKLSCFVGKQIERWKVFGEKQARSAVESLTVFALKRLNF